MPSWRHVVSAVSRFEPHSYYHASRILHVVVVVGVVVVVVVVCVWGVAPEAEHNPQPPTKCFFGACGAV